jgi:hypothetical protein
MPSPVLTKRLQINYYLTGELNPVIVIIYCEFHDEEQALSWEVYFQKLLRTHQSLNQNTRKQPTLKVQQQSAPNPRSKPAIVIPIGTTPNIDELLELKSLVI